MVTITDIPSDVLLEIVSNLNLAQVLCFLSTCSIIRKLTQSRYLWIGVLERTRATRCLPCPAGEDLSQMDLQELQHIAHHAHRLEHNWTRGSPRIIGAVKATQHEDGSQSLAIIAVIPGTDLVFLYSSRGQLSCFDVQTMARTPSLSLGKVVFDAHYDECGKHLMAIVSVWNVYHVLRVICVEYGHGRETTMRQIFSVALGAINTHTSIFVHADVVGVTMADSDTPFVFYVSAHNMVTNVSLKIPIKAGKSFETPIPISTHVLEGDLYIAMRAASQYSTYHFCGDVLPYGDSQGNANGQLVFDNQADCHDARDISVAQMVSALGLSTVSVKYPGGFSDLVTTEMWFLPRFPGTDLLTSSTSGDTSVSISLNAEVRLANGSRLYLISFTQSGAYTVLITDYTEDTGDVFTQLQLVHFIKDPPSVQIRPLALPFFIDLNGVQSIAVDDHRGMVFLSHRGYIFTVPYA